MSTRGPRQTLSRLHRPPIALTVIALFAAGLRAEVSLPRIFGDNMVLQRDRPVPVWLGLPFFAYNHGSILHLETHGLLFLDVSDPEFFPKLLQRRKIAEEMGAAYSAAGIVTLAGSRLYTSMADTDAVIEQALAGFRRVLESVEGVN